MQLSAWGTHSHHNNAWGNNTGKVMTSLPGVFSYKASRSEFEIISVSLRFVLVQDARQNWCLENAKGTQLSWPAQIQSWLWVSHVTTVQFTTAGMLIQWTKMMALGTDEQWSQGYTAPACGVDMVIAHFICLLTCQQNCISPEVIHAGFLLDAAKPDWQALAWYTQ